MEQNLSDIFDLVEHAIDNAFEGRLNLKFYDYLKDTKIKLPFWNYILKSEDLTMKLDKMKQPYDKHK